MKETRITMGMPVTIDIESDSVTQKDIERVFQYFYFIDETFSPFKKTSEVTKINRKEIAQDTYSDDMKEVIRLCEETKRKTKGYFNTTMPNGDFNPSGLVKGWAIYHAAELISDMGFSIFYVDAGGDIEARGRIWSVGIKNPFQQNEIVKVVHLKNQGIATSGTYIRGDHIYDPHTRKAATEILSFTVIAPNVYEADRFATAAFAMGNKGINFIEHVPGLEGYVINHFQGAVMTSGFEHFAQPLYVS